MSPPFISTLLLSGRQAVACTTRGCLLHLRYLPVAEVSACSRQAQSLRRVLFHELMLQGKTCNLSFVLWDQFPHLNPFTGQRHSV